MKAPPLLVNFSSLQRYLDALDAPTREEFGDHCTALFHKNMPAVVSVQALATLFGYRSQFLGGMIARPQKHYRVFSIPKGNSSRRIEAPKVGLKCIQKWLGHHLARSIEMPSQVVGFVPGRSIMHGACSHCGAAWVFHADLRDFFHTTTPAAAESALCRLGYPPHGAKIAAQLSSFGAGLAQGSPASPVLANLAFRHVDGQLIDMCAEKGYHYTRYADDIAISGTGDAPDDLHSALECILTESDWELAEQKTSMSVAPARMKVYGLLVNGARPRLTKGYRKRLRAIRHLLSEGKVPDDQLRQALGHVAYADSVEQFVPPEPEA